MSSQRRDRSPVDSAERTAENIKNFAEFRSESERSEPYRLDLGDGEVIEIAPPDTVEQVIELSEASHSPRAVLRILCGSHHERVFEALRYEHINVLNAFLGDLAEHFGMGALPPEDGGS